MTMTADLQTLIDLAPPLKVLLIDDDVDVVAWLSRCVSRLGGQCRTVQGLQQTIEMVRDWNPTHIILDLFMPGQNGMTIAHALAHARVDVPVILTTGGDKRLMEAVARSAKIHGLTISALLPKPFNRGQLAATLGKGIPQGLAKPALTPSLTLNRSFETDEIALAIRLGHIRPALQPKVCCADRSLVGFEALARWHHPEHGLIAPDQFISLAENGRLLEAMTLTMIDQSLEWLSQSRHGQSTMAFNVAPSLLRGDSFIAQMRAARERHGIVPTRIVLEVTESTKLGEDIATLDRLTGLRLEGFGLSIDDFGIGYSSLLQLAHLPFGEIKIDKTFVSSATHSQESRTIINSIVSLAQKLGMTTVAEGIEDEATFLLLKAMGCNIVQGYHFARPLSLAEAESCPLVFEASVARRAAGQNVDNW